VATAVASRLTETHRLAQARIGASTAGEMLAAFSILDPTRLDESFPDWLRVALALIERQHTASAQLSAAYLSAFRLAELGPDPTFAPTIARLDTAAAATSLLVTGPVSIKRAMVRGIDIDQAVENAAVASARAGHRHALTGGRDTIQETIKRDPRALGYRRVTSGSACKFCQMLADRGAVYKATTVDFPAHDGCSCSSEPVYAHTR
jgi:hypothetical protein